MPDDLLTRLDALRKFLLNHRDSMRAINDPLLREQGEALVDQHLDTLDDACEILADK